MNQSTKHHAAQSRTQRFGPTPTPVNETNANCPECGQLIEAGRPHISRERNGVMVCFVDATPSRMDELERNEIARGSVTGRIAILLFGDENNVTDEQCVDELQNQLAVLHEVREYLWPNQDGMPNKHRNCLVAIQAREQLASARIAELERGEQILWQQLAERDEVNAQLRAQVETLKEEVKNDNERTDVQ